MPDTIQPGAAANPASSTEAAPLVVRGARTHNLKNIDVTLPHRQADHRHRRQRIGQVVARLRHHLRRRAAALRRVAVGLRAAVPRADGEAGRRPDRRHRAGHRHPAEEQHPQPALDGRHDDRDPRLHAAAVRARRPDVLPRAAGEIVVRETAEVVARQLGDAPDGHAAAPGLRPADRRAAETVESRPAREVGDERRGRRGWTSERTVDPDERRCRAASQPASLPDSRRTPATGSRGRAGSAAEAASAADRDAAAQGLRPRCSSMAAPSRFDDVDPRCAGHADRCCRWSWIGCSSRTTTKPAMLRSG